jgi:hypothetical protein
MKDSITRSHEYCLLKKISMVVPSLGDATQLRSFVCQLEEELKASVLETITAWTNTDIALELQTSTIDSHSCTFTWRCNPATEIRLPISRKA